MIEIKNLEMTFPGNGGLLSQTSFKALRGINMKIQDGSAISVIGESGCGKTTLGRILAGYQRHTDGHVYFDGRDVDTLNKKERKAEFLKVQLIQQDPYAALNPSRTLGKALYEPLRLRAKAIGENHAWIEKRMEYLLALVGLDPVSTVHKYQHNLSGGQRQRFVIARSLTVDPKVLIADEAVSMIDVSLRLEVLNLLNDLRSRLGISVIFITHDVAAARYIADESQLYVIYKGEIVEQGKTDEVISKPMHPYTQSLLSAMPVLKGLESPGPERFDPIEAPNEDPVDTHCLFAQRCPFAQDKCFKEHPQLEKVVDDSRFTACFYPTPRRVAPVSNERDVS
ncbi:ABC transporter ATP-binding protein [Alicyclobacillus fodiniaquatilis]|uniref:ABC transporter ATP-binding protein n=1 Tax=Alicyclobacillus fodiniaquatilis TaxID=1661150 RepID=A0ABW4JIJ0_9BACL